MDMKINKRSIILFMSFFCLTMGESIVFVKSGINSFFEYTGYLILLVAIYYNYIKYEYNKSKIIYFLLILFLFNIGIIMQPSLDIVIKLRLILSMFILASFAIITEGYIKTFKDIAVASYGIFIGIMVSIIIAIIFGGTLIDASYEGLIGTNAFTGGLDNKNFFSGATLGVFSGVYLYNRFYKKSKLNIIIMLFSILMLIASNSRGGYILFIIFFVISNFNIIKKIKKNQRKMLVVLFFVLIVFGVIYFYNIVALNSSTYMYRVNGLLNLIEYYINDYFLIFFGASNIAFSDIDQSYGANVRSVLGWDGTTELVLLNILIKNGLLGLIGYIIIFTRIIKIAINAENREYKISILSIVVMLLISSLVEAYMVNLHLVFGIFCYIVIAGLCGMIKNYKIVNINKIK